MRWIGITLAGLAACSPLVAQETRPRGTSDRYSGRIRVVRRYRTPQDRAAMREKLRTIMVPKIRFKDLTVEEAIMYLRRLSKELDPDGVGVNFVVLTPEGKPQPKTEWDDDEFAPFGKELGWTAPADPPRRERR